MCFETHSVAEIREVRDWIEIEKIDRWSACFSSFSFCTAFFYPFPLLRSLFPPAKDTNRRSCCVSHEKSE